MRNLKSMAAIALTGFALARAIAPAIAQPLPDDFVYLFHPD